MSDFEQRLTAIEQRTVADDRLAQGVERLANETVGLNAILTRVDDQQQRLSTLGQYVERVDQDKASHDDVAELKKETHQEQLYFRKLVLQRTYTTAMFLLFAIAVVVGGFFSYQESLQQAQREVCEARTEQNDVIITLLEGSIQRGATAPAAEQIRETINRLRELNNACERL